MGRREKRQRKEGRNQFKEFSSMTKRLHEMLRSLGQQQIQGQTIKLDQFQRLRVDFVKCSQLYQKANTELKFQNHPVERAKLVYTMMDNKKQLESQLKQMTAIVMRLSQKNKREKLTKLQNKSVKPSKTNKYEEVMKDELEDREPDVSPLEKELEYKSLIVYTFQKNYFKLINKQDKDVRQVKRDVNNKKYQNLQAFLQQNQKVNRLLEEQIQQPLQQKQILEALKKIDNMIEQRMDKLLDGIKMLNYNAITISETLDNIHKKIIINLDHVEHNVQFLHSNQKRLDEAAKYVSKPSCIMNVVIAVLLGLMGYLIVRIVWFS